MAIRLPFIDRIRALSREFISRDGLALNRPRSYEVEILPSPSEKSPSSGKRAVKAAARGAAPPTSAGADRLWPQEQESSRKVESTHSNLG